MPVSNVSNKSNQSPEDIAARHQAARDAVAGRTLAERQRLAWDEEAGEIEDLGTPVDNRWGRLHVLRTNKVPHTFEVSAATRSRQQGQLLAYVRCPVFNPFNRADFYTDETRSTRLFTVKGRWPFTAAKTYFVRLPDGTVIGTFDKTVGRSFGNATMTLGTPTGIFGQGKDQNLAINKARRVIDFAAAVDFPFRTDAGREILSVTRGWGKTDPYLLSIPRLPNGRQLDWRVAASLAVIMDISLNASQF
jgi:hypothetical protein